MFCVKNTKKPDRPVPAGIGDTAYPSKSVSGQWGGGSNLRPMEFEAEVRGERFCFSTINPTTILVSGATAEYILYKRSDWHCADEISRELLAALSAAIESNRKA